MSGIKSPTQREPDRARNVILPETKQWSELASDASLTVIKHGSPVLRMDLSSKEREAGEQEERYLRLWVSSSCVCVYTHEYICMCMGHLPAHCLV